MSATITPAVEFSDLSTNAWTVFANANDPDIIGRFDTGDEVRSFLFDHSRFSDGDTVTLLDVDGLGSSVAIPIEWIGDGEPLVGSPRVLELL
jgi:hypothetical protein